MSESICFNGLVYIPKRRDKINKTLCSVEFVVPKPPYGTRVIQCRSSNSMSWVSAEPFFGGGRVRCEPCWVRLGLLNIATVAYYIREMIYTANLLSINFEIQTFARFQCDDIRSIFTQAHTHPHTFTRTVSLGENYSTMASSAA